MRFVSVCALSAAVSVVAAEEAEACGAGLVGETATAVTQQSQVSFVSVHPATNTTDVAVLLQVPAASSDFGALIPLPSRGAPVVDDNAIDASAFADLEAQTRPEFIPSDSGESGGGGLFGCGVGSRSLDGGGVQNGGGVVVGDAVDVGPVTAQWLVADDASALSAWLADNGFALPDGGDDVIDTYIAEGNGFLAFKRNEGGASDEPSAIGVRFTVPGDLRAIALRVTQLGAPDVLPLTTFVAFTDEVGPDAPYEAIHVGDLDDDAALADYAAVIDDAVAAAGGKAWIFEGSIGKPALAPSALTSLVDDGAFISRLSTRIARDAVDADVVFSGPAPTPKQTAAASAMTLPKNVDVAAVVLVGVTLVVRRRRRR